MSEKLNSEVIEAAGGIIECATSEGPLIAVANRERYGGEWGLPKSKRQAGESWQKTALREVREETGLAPDIVDVAGATAYLAEEPSHGLQLLASAIDDQKMACLVSKRLLGSPFGSK
jgi:ADP-ribose pyrophosphatase YjhB (NUDIX family)